MGNPKIAIFTLVYTVIIYCIVVDNCALLMVKSINQAYRHFVANNLAYFEVYFLLVLPLFYLFSWFYFIFFLISETDIKIYDSTSVYVDICLEIKYNLKRIV